MKKDLAINMKKITVLICLFTLVFNTQAQLENSLLWKISGNDLKETSYLYGTYHSSEQEVYFLMDSVQTLIQQCEIMAGEVNMEEEANMDPMMLVDMMMMKEKTLKDLYSKKEYKYVNEMLQKEMGIMAMMTESMKPIYISVLLSEGVDFSDLSQIENEGKVLDDSLQVYSKNIGVTVVGLETAEEALAVIDQISLKEQAEMLMQTLEDLEDSSADELMKDLMNLYLAQDLNGMLAYYKEQEVGDDFESQLVDFRNDYFVERVLIHMKNKPTFCAVGSLHLPGETGMIAQLRSLGYTVEPIMYTGTGK